MRDLLGYLKPPKYVVVSFAAYFALFAFIFYEDHGIRRILYAFATSLLCAYAVNHSYKSLGRGLDPEYVFEYRPKNAGIAFIVVEAWILLAFGSIYGIRAADPELSVYLIALGVLLAALIFPGWRVIAISPTHFVRRTFYPGSLGKNQVYSLKQVAEFRSRWPFGASLVFKDGRSFFVPFHINFLRLPSANERAVTLIGKGIERFRAEITRRAEKELDSSTPEISFKPVSLKFVVATGVMSFAFAWISISWLAESSGRWLADEKNWPTLRAEHFDSPTFKLNRTIANSVITTSAERCKVQSDFHCRIASYAEFRAGNRQPATVLLDKACSQNDLVACYSVYNGGAPNEHARQHAWDVFETFCGDEKNHNTYGCLYFRRGLKE